MIPKEKENQKVQFCKKLMFVEVSDAYKTNAFEVIWKLPRRETVILD